MPDSTTSKWPQVTMTVGRLDDALFPNSQLPNSFHHDAAQKASADALDVWPASFLLSPSRPSRPSIAGPKCIRPANHKAGWISNKSTDCPPLTVLGRGTH